MRKGVAVVVVVVLLAAAVYLGQPVEVDHPSAAVPPAQPIAEAAQPARPPEVAVRENGIEVVSTQPEPEPLPALSDSDPIVQSWVVGQAGQEFFEALSWNPSLVQRLVATIDALPSAQLPPVLWPANPPGGNFLVVDGPEGQLISPLNNARYAPYIRIIGAIDPEALVQAYRGLEPLFQEAYQELGRGDLAFNDRLIEVLEHLMQTPRPGGEPVVLPSEAIFIFADIELESLSGGQKLLLRLGSDQSSIVRDKIEELHRLLADAPPAGVQ